MNLLLDTHILIWALNNDKKLPEKARELILDEGNAIYYSTASVWEISIKHAAHPDNVEFSGKVFSAFCHEAGYLSLEIRDKHVHTLETIKRSDKAPSHHDPFDRILLAQAKSEHMYFVTHDKLITQYSEDCIIHV